MPPRQLTPEDEAALVQQAQQQSAHFRLIYEAYAQRVYAYVAYRVRQAQEAEDLTATIFMKALDRLHQYSAERGSFSAWLFTIARHTVIDHWLLDKSEPEALLTSVPLNVPSPESTFLQNEHAATMQAVIAQLSTRRQEVIVLKFFSGLRNQEIATILELDERTVASHLSRALDDLKQLLQEEMPYESH